VTPAEQRFRQSMEEAVTLHRSGQRAAAIARYRQLRVQQPFLPPLLNLLGLALVQDNKVDEGLSLLSEAVRRAPTFVDAWLNLAFAKHEARDPQGAREAYKRILELQPDHLTALMSFASLAAEEDTTEAIALLRKAVQIAPDRAHPWLRLRRLCNLNGDLAGIAEADRHIQRLRLESGEELVELGGIYMSQQRYDKATEAYREALKRRPDLGMAALGLGAALRDQRVWDEAKAAFQRAAELMPRRTDPLIGLGLTCVAAGDRTAAADAFRGALQRNADDAVAQHMLNAMLGNTTDAAPVDFVIRTFDGFSVTYEAVMTRERRYRAPEEIAAHLGKLYPGRAFQRLFDIGCGTGLVARALATATERRVGIDLSHLMLGQARKAGLYHELIEQEAVAYLANTQQSFDLIVAAEVLTYIGNLAALFDQVVAHLDPGGVFVVTTERLEEAGTTRFELRDSGRYAHTDSYLRSQASRVGMAIDHLATIDLRLEREIMLPGTLAVFRKPG
jgi:predicted TPR repeat methyltransferase